MKRSELVHRFKARKMCPVVAVTAFTDHSVFKEAEKVGMKEVLHKPLQHSKLC